MTTIAEHQIQSKGSFWGATALISSTCIGGGMLVMPVQTAETGFFLSFLAIAICWMFMTFTGLLLVEATGWIRNETHFASLTRILIGNKTKILALIVYLFMNFASLVAYTAGGSGLLNIWSKAAFGIDLGYTLGCTLFSLIFGSIVYLGTHIVSRLNFIMMAALVFSYFGLVGFGFGNIHASNLAFRPAWREAVGIVSMILATFSYQMVVPSVCSYMQYDKSALKKAIITGTTIPFVVYSLWLLVIHGCIPLDGENGLREAYIKGSAATVPLRSIFNHWSLTLLADFFAFFAISTSYLCLSLALFDFLRDGLKEFKLSLNSASILLITIIPVLFLATSYPRALLQCLDMSGGFGDTILSGLIPISIVWVGRYHKKMSDVHEVPGGKVALSLGAVFFFAFLMIQFYEVLK